MLLFFKVDLWDLKRWVTSAAGTHLPFFLWKLQIQDQSSSGYRGATLPSQRVLLDRSGTEGASRDFEEGRGKMLGAIEFF